MQSSSQIITTNKPTSSYFTGRMPFLSPNQQCQSTEGKNITSHGPAYPSSPGGLPTMFLTTNSSWLPWRRFAMLKSSPPTNQHPVFTGRMPFLSPNQQCQSTKGKNITSHGLAYPSSPGGLPTLFLTTNSSWLPWRRFAMPLISPLMPVLLKDLWVKNIP